MIYKAHQLGAVGGQISEFYCCASRKRKKREIITQSFHSNGKGESLQGDGFGDSETDSKGRYPSELWSAK